MKDSVKLYLPTSIRTASWESFSKDLRLSDRLGAFGVKIEIIKYSNFYELEDIDDGSLVRWTDWICRIEEMIPLIGGRNILLFNDNTVYDTSNGKAYDADGGYYAIQYFIDGVVR